MTEGVAQAQDVRPQLDAVVLAEDIGHEASRVTKEQCT
ncbi:MAG: hypothetical protein QOI98_3748, partial [Solirubrobacteraceae bacterium]|nr:hypothetical protein [Solirubrobacteraceae bacterium]